jgi:hypothetical protein
MKRPGIFSRLLIIAALVIGGLTLMFFSKTGPVRAVTATPTPGPDRFTHMQVDVSAYQWWLLEWEDSEVICQLTVYQSGLPSHDDVYTQCGEKIYTKWVERSKPCAETDITACKGFYFMLLGEKTVQREVPTQLPEPKIWVSLEDCQPDRRGWCTNQPRLILQGEEPLEGYTITSIQGYVGKDTFTCAGNVCSFGLDATAPEGVNMIFWGSSSYGDSTKVYEAQVKVLSYKKENQNALLDKWFVSVLSTQWTGDPPASCALTWGAFPPMSELPSWLQTPETSEQLQTDIPLAYLAGKLIAGRAVDASSCADGGLTPDGTASPCGVELARPAVEEWQNRFDAIIVNEARTTGVPAQLLKNLFSRESQFWPGKYPFKKDVGLGQLTEKGADTMLLWNPAFYNDFCPLILGENLCRSTGYGNLTKANRAMLIGALLQSVDATCVDCPLGIDLPRADYSISVFSRAILANCEQAGAAVKAITGKRPGATISYEDMWRLTLVNYNAGVGCLYDALDSVKKGGQAYSWENISQKLSAVCPGAETYVRDIAR